MVCASAGCGGDNVRLFLDQRKQIMQAHLTLHLPSGLEVSLALDDFCEIAGVSTHVCFGYKRVLLRFAVCGLF